MHPIAMQRHPIRLTPASPRFGHHKAHDPLLEHPAPAAPTRQIRTLAAALLSGGILLSCIALGTAENKSLPQPLRWLQGILQPAKLPPLGSISEKRSEIPLKGYISPQKEVFMNGILMGTFNDQGVAFSALGKSDSGEWRLGRAGENGKMYLDLAPEKPIGQLHPDGSFTQFFRWSDGGLNSALITDFKIDAPGLTLQQKAAAAMLIISQQYTTVD